jgi:hypothetical protein
MRLSHKRQHHKGGQIGSLVAFNVLELRGSLSEAVARLKMLRLLHRRPFHKKKALHVGAVEECPNNSQAPDGGLVEQQITHSIWALDARVPVVEECLVLVRRQILHSSQVRDAEVVRENLMFIRRQEANSSQALEAIVVLAAVAAKAQCCIMASHFPKESLTFEKVAAVPVQSPANVPRSVQAAQGEAYHEYQLLYRSGI